jgi:hypothetical protein
MGVSFLELELIIKVSRSETPISTPSIARLVWTYIIGTNSALSAKSGEVSGKMTFQFLFQL